MEAENPIEYREIVKGNPDFAGWISSAGTSIDYPVMQMSWEPEYYLHRNFAGEDSFAGVPFMGSGDMKEGDIFLYGHNMKNGTMCADLLKYQKEGAVQAVHFSLDGCSLSCYFPGGNKNFANWRYVTPVGAHSANCC